MTIAALALAGVLALGQEPPRYVGQDPDLIGAWTDGSFTVSVLESAVYVIVDHQGRVAEIGRATTRDGVVRFTPRDGADACEEAGSLRYTISRDTLTFGAGDDPCERRVRFFQASTWRALPAPVGTISE